MGSFFRVSTARWSLRRGTFPRECKFSLGKLGYEINTRTRRSPSSGSYERRLIAETSGLTFFRTRVLKTWSRVRAAPPWGDNFPGDNFRAVWGRRIKNASFDCRELSNSPENNSKASPTHTHTLLHKCPKFSSIYPCERKA